MTVRTEIDSFFQLQDMCWSGAKDTLREVARQGKCDELMDLLEELFADSNPSDTDINDFIWFEVADREWLDLYPEDHEDEESDEDSEDAANHLMQYLTEGEE